MIPMGMKPSRGGWVPRSIRWGVLPIRDAADVVIVHGMNEHIELINRYYTAINERRFDDYDALFAPEATLEGPGGVTGTGADAMRAFDQVWTNASSDFRITPLVQLCVDGKVSSENLVEATHDGLLRLPSGDLPATGRTFGGRYVGMFEVAGGRITSQHVYFDRMIVVDQLMSALA